MLSKLRLHTEAGIPPFRFYALADEIKNILSQTSPSPPEQQPSSLQMELLPCLFLMLDKNIVAAEN